jgi:hypothetical protein
MSIELVFRFNATGKQTLADFANTVKTLNGEMKVGDQVVKKFDTTVQELSKDVEKAGKEFAALAAGGKRVKESVDAAAGSAKGFGESMTGSFLKAQILAEGLGQVVQVTKELTVESAKYAARTQTLGVVADQLARVNNLSVVAMRAEVMAVQRLGITRQESLSTINKMIFAQLDLKRATDLARLSQDAAVIAGINSSEALQGIIHGIVTRQPEVLRTYGIVVDFEREYLRVARERGHQLSAQEKQEVALQMVLAQSPKIAGAYEASMLTVGKQMTSLTRYTLDAKEAIGEGLIPVLGKAVMWMSDLAKWAGENGSEIGKLSVGVSAAAAAYTLLSLTPMGRGARIGAALYAGAGAAAFAPEMEDTIRDFGGRAVSDVMKRRAAINSRLAAPGLTPAEANTLKKQFEDTDATLARVKESATEMLVDLYDQRLKNRAFDPNRLAVTDPRFVRGAKGLSEALVAANQSVPASATRLLSGIDLGGGIQISESEMMAAVGRRAAGDPNGATLNQQAIDRAEMAERQRLAAEQFGKASKEVRGMLESLREQGLDPYFKIFYDEAQAIRNLKEKYPAGVTAPMLAQVRSVFGTRANELREEKLAPADLERRSRRTERDLYALRGPGFLFGNAFSDTPMRSVELDPSIAEKRIADFRERGTRALSQSLSYQERMIQLQTGPGGELAAIDLVARVRLDNAQKVYDLSKRSQEDLNALEERRLQIGRDREIQQLEFMRRRDDQTREFSGRVFDSMTANGGGGVRDMLTGQARVLQRQLFVNGTSGAFSAVGRYAGGLIPGQQNADGTPTMVGKLLAGTVFDKQNTQLDKNTNSLERARRSIDRLTSTIGGVGVGGDPLAGVTSGWKDPMTLMPSVGGFDTGSLVRQIPGTQKIAGSSFGKNVSGFVGGAGSFFTAGPLAGFRGGDYSVKTGDGRATTASSLGYTSTASRAGNVAMSAAVLGTGAISTYQSLRSGNYMGAAASGLATAAAFNPEPISKAAMLLAAAVIPLFGGNRREKRGERLNSLVEESKRDEPTGQSYTFDTSGRSLDYDYRGGLRTYVTVVNQVRAIDARGVEQFFEENQYGLAQSVGRAWQNGQAPALEQQLRNTFGG